MCYQETRIVNVLRSVFGYDDFKNDTQKEAVAAICKGSTCVYICMPPGSGKSLCFQLPAIMYRGKITIVFSPKLSFMKNQVEFLQSRKINASLLSHDIKKCQRQAIIKDLLSDFPNISLLYTTPEIALMGYFQCLVAHLKEKQILSYIVYQDAHCLSEWGYEYAPSYVKVFNYDALYKNIPRIALTAPANDKAMRDICNILKMESPKIFNIPVYQTNMYYDVWFLDILYDAFKHLKTYIIEMLGILDFSVKQASRGIVIYCQVETVAKEVHSKLNAFGIPSILYHHKLNKSMSHDIENKWTSTIVRVLVTTYDYGFIHKKLIGCIIYWMVPENIPKYFKESVRIQNNNSLTYCRIYFSTKEYSFVKSLIENHRNQNGKEHIRKRLHEFDRLVSYCLSAKCRHSMITEYFGIVTPLCKTNCDVCKDEDVVRSRITKFISYSQTVESITYNICRLNDSLKEERKKENIKDALDKLSISETRKEIEKPNNENRKQHDQLNSIDNNTITGVQTKTNVTDEKSTTKDTCNLEIVTVYPKDNSSKKTDDKYTAMQNLLKEYNVDLSAISLEPCCSKRDTSSDVVILSKTSSFRTKTSTSVTAGPSRHSESSNAEKVKKDLWSDNSAKVTFTVETVEENKKSRKRRLPGNVFQDESVSKERKRERSSDAESITITKINVNKRIKKNHEVYRMTHGNMDVKTAACLKKR